MTSCSAGQHLLQGVTAACKVLCNTFPFDEHSVVVICVALSPSWLPFSQSFVLIKVFFISPLKHIIFCQYTFRDIAYLTSWLFFLTFFIYLFIHLIIYFDINICLFMIHKLYFSPVYNTFHPPCTASIFHLLNRLPPSLYRAPPTVTSSPIPHSNILPLAYLLFTLFLVTLQGSSSAHLSHMHIFLICASVMCLIFYS